MLLRPAILIVITSVAALFATVALPGHGPGSASEQAGGIAFLQGELAGGFDSPTSLTFGPDGRLYVASLQEIHALTLAPDGMSVADTETIATDLSGVVGIAFDPTTPSPVTLYATRQDGGATDGYNGVVSRFTAPTWTREDVITGLPTSDPFSNHLTNGIAFDGAGLLYIAQGSSTDAGITDPPGAQIYWPETPLSAAILTADIHAPGFDGSMTYDPPGPPADDNVDIESGDVEVYAPGLRNPYDLVLHSNGLIYATDNAAMGKGTSLTCETQGGTTSTLDELNLVEEGNYYGFPNRNRGRFDERQCTYHSPLEDQGEGFTQPIEVLENHCSCDGIAEYTSDAFGGEMEGDLLYVEWTHGRLRRAELSDDGRSVLGLTTISPDFDMPLDVTVAENGTIYVADFDDGDIDYLVPLGEPDPTPTSSPEPPATPTPEATATSPPAATPTAPPPDTPTSTPPDGELGDANCDGEIDSIDAALVLQLAAGLTASLPCQEAADVDENNSVNAIDAALILQRVAGLIDSFRA